MKMATAIEHFFSNRKLGVSANKLKQIIFDMKEEIKIKLEIRLHVTMLNKFSDM